MRRNGLYKMKKFKAKTEEQINQIIEEWHMTSLYPNHFQVYDALGWTWEEYSTWVETDKIPK